MSRSKPPPETVSGGGFNLSEKAALPAFSARTRFPCACGAAGETRRETLLRKASEPAAHVAGFGLQLEGFGPPNLPQGVLRRSAAADGTGRGWPPLSASPQKCVPFVDTLRPAKPAQDTFPLRARGCGGARPDPGRPGRGLSCNISASAWESSCDARGAV